MTQMSGCSRGQSILEYAVFVAVVAAAIAAMGTYVQRAIQANLKQVEDHINAEACSPPATCPDPTGPP